MSKQKDKRWRLIACIALATILCLGMALPAFAAGEPIYGTPENPADAAITKMLSMPIGTTTPTTSFVFDIAKKSLDGVSTPTELAKMPGIMSKTVSFTTGDAGYVAGGTKYVPKESPNTLFDGISWGQAGVFIYTVKENKTLSTPAYPIKDPVTDFVREDMMYTTAEYDVAVYVVPDEDGNLYAYAISATLMVKGLETAEVDDKVDPTPGGDPEIEGDYSKMIFTNIYVKNKGGTTPDYTTFVLSKVVTGTDVTGSMRLETIFPFQVKVTKPALVTGAPVYKAYVIDADGNIMDTIPTAMTTGTIGNDGTYDYIAFPSGELIPVNILHGEKLQFIDLHVGASVEATEDTPTGYTPSYQLTLDDSPKPVQPGAQNTPLGFPSDKDPGVKYIGEGSNKADFTNRYQMTTPTGISVDSLPYIALIAAAVLALAVFVGFAAVKSRRKAKHGA